MSNLAPENISPADPGLATADGITGGSLSENARRRPATPGELWSGAILPGLGHWLRGERQAGAVLLAAWLLLLVTIWFTSGRALEILSDDYPPLDGIVAVATLLLLPALLWGWAFYDLKWRASKDPGEKGDSQWAVAIRRFRRNRLALFGLVLMLFLYLIALITPLIAPYDPIAQDQIVQTRYQPPSAEYLMGTDRFGRDVFSRVLYGARISLSIGFIAVGLGLLIGTMIGATAGYFGGRTDSILMRFTDMMLSFPRLVLLILVIALFEPSIWLVITVLGLTGWMGIARIVRGEVLSLREREFVLAARALGMNDFRIITRHILPATLAPMIVYATLGIGNTILTEAGLSFLGLGVQPPVPSWGNMISQGRDTLVTAWWIATFPGLAIVFTVMAFNFVGDGLRDALDPRQRR